MVHALLESIGIDKPILAGHSFGGKVSLIYASKYPTEKLILFGSPFKVRIKKPTLKMKVLKGLKKLPGMNKIGEEMKKHIMKIQPLAAEASKKFWRENPQWKQKHLQDMQKGWNNWKQNNFEQYQNNLKYAQSKAKEWRENNKRQFELNRQKAVNATKKPVELINTGETFESASAAARQYNIAATGISACCRGVRKSCGRDINNKKMVWRYINDD